MENKEYILGLELKRLSTLNQFYFEKYLRMKDELRSEIIEALSKDKGTPFMKDGVLYCDLYIELAYDISELKSEIIKEIKRNFGQKQVKSIDSPDNVFHIIFQLSQVA